MCDMCSSTEKKYKIDFEGAKLDVCEQCSVYGKRIKTYMPENNRSKKDIKHNSITKEASANNKETETIQLIVSNYSRLIKQARENKGLKQEELAKKLAEKESVIHNLESGHAEPNLELARKIEHFLKIKLIESIELGKDKFSKSSSDNKEMTLGDMITIKKRS